jgi:hypothetical protein
MKNFPKKADGGGVNSVNYNRCDTALNLTGRKYVGCICQNLINIYFVL